MNQFTKEELTRMCDGIVLIKNTCSIRDSLRAELDALDAKLCGMINNYCPHTSAIPNFGIVKHCTDCKELVGGEIRNDGTVGYTIPKYEYAREGDVVTYKLKGFK